jgi:hypothetical protein
MSNNGFIITHYVPTQLGDDVDSEEFLAKKLPIDQAQCEEVAD